MLILLNCTDLILIEEMLFLSEASFSKYVSICKTVQWVDKRFISGSKRFPKKTSDVKMDRNKCERQL